MAGARQHYIPQALQRNFAVKGRKDAYLIWHYRSDGSFRQISTEDLWVSKWFYRDEIDNVVDEKITFFENKEINHYIRALGNADDPEINPALISKIIANLEIRTKNFRVSLDLMLDDFVKLISDRFSDPKTLTELLVSHLKANPNILVSELSKRLVEPSLRDGIRKSFERSVDPFLESIAPQFTPVLQSAFHRLGPELKELVKRLN